MNFPHLDKLSTILQANANPEIAAQQITYMRNQFDFFGIKAPDLRKLSKDFIKKAANPDKTLNPDLIRAMWDKPQREFQFIALDLMMKYAKYAPENMIELYEEIILSKSWWDTVDMIAKNMVGVHFTIYPYLMLEYNDKWQTSDNIWLNRTTIIFQLGYKKKTNWNLLEANILAKADSNEFFIQKAIGWALREYSKVDPDLVVEFIENAPLAPLSKREGLKWLKNKHWI